METIVFGGGCFWCTEAIFKMLRGVSSVTPGYAGGHTKNPNYYKLHAMGRDHAEVVQIVYDPALVSFRDLLTVFFGSHDATEVDRQGHDVGPEYRSIILYTREEQKEEAEAFIQELNDSSPIGKPIATEVKALDTFYEAEKEHLDFYAKNKDMPYCQIIIEPKLEKVQKAYAQLLKERLN
jgi:peptide-methionine (S)-S-oxide reductase